MVCLWIGGFVSCYGLRCSARRYFRYCFCYSWCLGRAVVLDRVIRWLQEGSTDITYAIFKALGVPVFRERLCAHGSRCRD